MLELLPKQIRDACRQLLRQESSEDDALPFTGRRKSEVVIAIGGKLSCACW
ncbi:hypothetical protein HRbin17_00723 [bacterium HR17]|jgi:hypothetical protein|uniref:Uncharacterized protein n=1 Tax=Candidatus Fervidibacter japonicus TaxID=2035412 RepID=A0A2H5XAN7_9BACT|nr:hypothetical protein HRbin17_00723 [bacterium HR17]